MLATGPCASIAIAIQVISQLHKAFVGAIKINIIIDHPRLVFPTKWYLYFAAKSHFTLRGANGNGNVAITDYEGRTYSALSTTNREMSTSSKRISIQFQSKGNSLEVMFESSEDIDISLPFQWNLWKCDDSNIGHLNQYYCNRIRRGELFTDGTYEITFKGIPLHHCIQSFEKHMFCKIPCFENILWREINILGIFWSKKTSTHCVVADRLFHYDSVRQAKNACSIDPNCGAVYDEDCKHKKVWLCSVGYSEEVATTGSCLFEKPGK